MKTILAVGELANFTNVYKASLVAMMAGESLMAQKTLSHSPPNTLLRQW